MCMLYLTPSAEQFSCDGTCTLTACSGCFRSRSEFFRCINQLYGALVCINRPPFKQNRFRFGIAFEVPVNKQTF